jgi:hypothetical protein
VIGVHSCQVSQANSDLRNYAVSVSSLMQESNNTGRQLFTVLSSGGGPGSSSNLQTQAEEAGLTAGKQLNRARGLSAPGQLQGAQAQLVQAMEMRANGINGIAAELPSAFQPQTSSASVERIAANMAQFYASDVLYKDYMLPMLVSALHNAGIAAGGPNGEPINQDQFLPDIQWLSPSFVAAELGAPTSTAHGGKLAPGTHGHALNSVSVGGKTLQSGVTNTVSAHPAPTFTLNFMNSGANTETDVICKVSVGGTSISGQTTVPRTSAGQTYTCHVTLSSSPASGSYTVRAMIEPVPGEKNIANNTLTYSVSFQ